jgi:hypothetical protein
MNILGFVRQLKVLTLLFKALRLWLLISHAVICGVSGTKNIKGLNWMEKSVLGMKH